MDENLPLDVLHPFEDEIINIGTRTALKLLSLGSDELALYTFYCITAKRQSIALRKRITTIKATESYCLRGLGWGHLRFRTTKKSLMEAGLVKNIIKKEDGSGKVIGYYIQINYVPIETSRVENQSVDSPPSGQSHEWSDDTPNTVITNNINTDKDKLNTGVSQDSLSKAELFTKDFLLHFNTVYTTKYRTIQPYLKPLSYWLEHYSMDEIKQAITNSKEDNWWADKLTPTILLRRSNPNHEPVDYIGKFLNMSAIGTFDGTPMTPIELWTMAKHYDINLEDVNQKHKDVLSEAEKRSFPTKYKYASVKEAVKAWVEMGISKGQIKNCNEIEKMQLDNDHPDKIAERKYYFDLMRKKGVLE